MEKSNTQQMKEERLKHVTTYAFVGAAGTGKSQRAQSVASIIDADYIIDDGLVIHKGSIVCGKSAKSERNQISAIKRALFEFEDHRNEVMDFFSNAAPCTLMIIATSDDMIIRIIKKLKLPLPEKIVRIEDVAAPEEIDKARKERFTKGKHVIPVSHVLVRKNFAGKLVGQLRVFWKSKDNHEGEKTIVRPPFSFYGEVHIEPQAIEDLVTFIAGRTSQVAKVLEVSVSPENEESLSITIKIAASIGDKNFVSLANLIKERTAVSVRYFTGINVKNVDVIIMEVLI